PNPAQDRPGGNPGRTQAPVQPAGPGPVHVDGPGLRPEADDRQVHHAGVHRPGALPGLGADGLPGAGPVPRPVRAGPARVRAHRRVPRRPGQRAVAPADPARSRAAPRPTAVVPAAPAGALAGRVLLLPRVLAAVRDPPGLELPANADFEDHAEHEYMAYVAEHPELETQPDPGTFAAQYGQYGSLADLLRQIGHDERTHKQGSLTNMRTPRPRDPHPAA